MIASIDAGSLRASPCARSIDMNSFDFVTATCGTCHPGGGPMGLDRDGKRQDPWMGDPGSGFTAGGDVIAFGVLLDDTCRLLADK